MRRELPMLLLALAGCAPSLRSDLTRVQDLSRTPLAVDLADRDVDTSSSGEVRAMLSSPLNADAAVRIAVMGNRPLRATLRELGIARGQLSQAGLLPNPRLGVEFLPERNTQLEFRVEYDLMGLVLAPMRARAATADFEAARYQSAAAVLTLGFEVRAAFFGLQAAEERLRVAQRTLETFAAGREAAQAMFAAGNIPALDLASQEATYQQARITVAETELEALDRREELQRLMGLHGEETRWTVVGPLPAVPEELAMPDHMETRAVRASLMVAELRSRMESAARRAGVARVAGLIPELSVDVHALTGNPEQGTDSGSQATWRFGAGLDMTLPVFNRSQGQARATEAEFDGLMERTLGAAIDTRSAAREARNHVASAHVRARQYDGVIVPARAAVLAQTVLQYNAMAVGVFQVLEARRAQLDAELNAIEMRRMYWTECASLDALLAGVRVEAPNASSMSQRTSMNTQATSGGH